MVCIRKVGIYKDTGTENGVILVVRTKEGTLYFAFDGNAFIDGWFSESGRKRGSPYRKQEGALREMQKGSPTPLHPLFCEAMLAYRVTPTSINGLEGTGPRKVKWVDRRKGGWGGSRKAGGASKPEA